MTPPPQKKVIATSKAPIEAPMPEQSKSPVRYSICGLTDKIPDLKTAIAAETIPDDLKTFIAAELDKLGSNAATIHLHDILRPGGGFDMHLSITPFQLGGKAS